MPLEPDETTLRDGYRLKKIGNVHAILDEHGMQVGPTCRIETLAVRRLLDHRIAYAARARFIGGAQRDKFIQEQQQEQGAGHA